MDKFTLKNILQNLAFSIVIIAVLSCNKKNGQNKTIKINGSSRNKVPKVISDSTNTLSGIPITIKLEFISVGCACASWLNVKDEDLFNKGHVEKLMFIEPAKSSLKLSNKFDPPNEEIIVGGEFYIKEDYPKGTMDGGEEHLEKSRVFRYTNIRIVKKKFSR